MPDYSDDIFYGAHPELFKRARELRKRQTDAERILWNELKNRKLKGFKFRRQHPLNYFVADFYCHEAKLVVELDGSIHDIESQKEYDEERTDTLRRLGIKVIRFKNEEVIAELDVVLRKIGDALLSI